MIKLSVITVTYNCVSSIEKTIESRILEQGDIILLAYGGHGFEMLEPTEIIEVKQGPYAGENDKSRFIPNLPKKLNFGN